MGFGVSGTPGMVGAGSSGMAAGGSTTGFFAGVGVGPGGVVYMEPGAGTDPVIGVSVQHGL